MTIEENCKQAGFDVLEVVQIEGSPIKGHAVVLGKRMEGKTLHDFATWEYNEWSGLYWGHYCINSSCEAHIQFHKRIAECYLSVLSEGKQ